MQGPRFWQMQLNKLEVASAFRVSGMEQQKGAFFPVTASPQVLSWPDLESETTFKKGGLGQHKAEREEREEEIEI